MYDLINTVVIFMHLVRLYVYLYTYIYCIYIYICTVNSYIHWKHIVWAPASRYSLLDRVAVSNLRSDSTDEEAPG